MLYPCFKVVENFALEFCQPNGMCGLSVVKFDSIATKIFCIMLIKKSIVATKNRKPADERKLNKQKCV